VVVDDPEYKARALQALMVKMQPEGRHVPIDHTLPMYRGALQKVGVFRVINEGWTGKAKFGQNEPARLRRIFVGKLRERGAPVDLLTAGEIEKSLGDAAPAGLTAAAGNRYSSTSARNAFIACHERRSAASL
jgi:hypothetical protein